MTTRALVDLYTEVPDSVVVVVLVALVLAVGFLWQAYLDGPQARQ